MKRYVYSYKLGSGAPTPLPAPSSRPLFQRLTSLSWAIIVVMVMLFVLGGLAVGQRATLATSADLAPQEPSLSPPISSVPAIAPTSLPVALPTALPVAPIPVATAPSTLPTPAPTAAAQTSQAQQPQPQAPERSLSAPRPARSIAATTAFSLDRANPILCGVVPVGILLLTMVVIYPRFFLKD
jgi:hypothetical protein